MQLFQGSLKFKRRLVVHEPRRIILVGRPRRAAGLEHKWFFHPRTFTSTTFTKDMLLLHQLPYFTGSIFGNVQEPSRISLRGSYMRIK